MQSRFNDIRQWAMDRNLITGTSAEKQFLKLAEEFGELGNAIGKDNLPEIKDAIGDMIVVLTILSSQYGVNVEYCIDSAWEEIKDRKGKMINGIFVKEK